MYSGELQFLNDNNFASVTKGKIFIVDFYADWCGPCVAFAPTFEAVAKKMSSTNFAKVNVDNSPKLSAQFNIEFIPYIVAVKEGKVLEQYNGSRTEQDFQSWCSKMTGNSVTEKDNKIINDKESSENTLSWSGLWVTKFG
ncbi:MAG TPA: thioredoxin family protein, partial [Spirochaetota bacterium]|nr:thioredoxin family protein [Spirochaetota bacterium]